MITLTTIVLATIVGAILTVRKRQKRKRKNKYKNINFIRGLHEQDVKEEAIAMAERDIAYIRESKARIMPANNSEPTYPFSKTFKKSFTKLKLVLEPSQGPRKFLTSICQTCLNLFCLTTSMKASE